MNQPSRQRPKKILVVYNYVEPSAPKMETSEEQRESEESQEREFDNAPTVVIPAAVEELVRLKPAEVREADAVVQALSESGYAAVAINLEDDCDRLAHAVVVHRPAAIFNLVYQFYDGVEERAAVAGQYDLYGFPYTFAGPLALTTCQERARCHLLLEDGNVPVPGFEIVRDVNVIPDTSELRFPLIATQAYDDTYDYEGYRGAITDREALEMRLQALAADYDMPLLIEEYIDGPRIFACVVGNRLLDVLPLVERTHNDESGLEELRLAQLDIDVAGQVRQLARRAFRIMGCRDAAQIDFVQGEDGRVYVTDVRPMFDLGEGSVFELAAYHSDAGFDGLIAEIARGALSRNPEEPAVPAPAPPVPEEPEDNEPEDDDLDDGESADDET